MTMVQIYTADRTIQNIDVANPDVFAGPQNKVINVDEDATTAILAAPGVGHAIWVYAIHLQASVGQQGTVRLQESGGSALTGDLTMSNADSFVWSPSGNFSMPWLKLNENQGLSLTCVTIAADGVVTYAIVDV